MELIEVFDTTDLETVHELAGNPEIELEISHLYHDVGDQALPVGSYTKLPEHVRAKLTTRHRRLIMENVISCADITGWYCKIFHAPKLKSAGKLHFRYGRHIMARELHYAVEIDAGEAEFVSLPKLYRCGGLYGDHIKEEDLPTLRFIKWLERQQKRGANPDAH